MTVEVVVPEMGESVLEATVSAWLKQEGEYVNVGDVLVELETDKVNLEVGAKSAGNLAQIKAKQGQDVKVGEVLAVIDEKAPEPEKVPAEQQAAKEQAAPKETTRANGREKERQPA